jgi:hypothetical protein
MTTTKTETLAAVKARQVIWVDWMEKATAGLTDESLVEVTTQHTPFGDYCLGIRPGQTPKKSQKKSIDKGKRLS